MLESSFVSAVFWAILFFVWWGGVISWEVIGTHSCFGLTRKSFPAFRGCDIPGPRSGGFFNHVPLEHMDGREPCHKSKKSPTGPTFHGPRNLGI